MSDAPIELLFLFRLATSTSCGSRRVMMFGVLQLVLGDIINFVLLLDDDILMLVCTIFLIDELADGVSNDLSELRVIVVIKALLVTQFLNTRSSAVVRLLLCHLLLNHLRWL